MPRSDGSQATPFRPLVRSVDADLVSLVRPPSAEDGPVFAAVWHEQAGRPPA